MLFIGLSALYFLRKAAPDVQLGIQATTSTLKG
jgi:hypothetical protein